VIRKWRSGSKKRWFSGSGCTLENIFRICEILEISFFDLAELAKKGEEVAYVLTPEQELFFSKKPAYFGILKQLHRGHSMKAIAEYWRLDVPKLFHVLRKMEKQNLLDVLPDNGVRVKVRGNIHYQDNGPLARVILRPQILRFLDHLEHSVGRKDTCLHSAELELSESHITEFVHEINQLGAKYRALAVRDKSLLPAKKLKLARWLLALAPYETNWRQYPL
jgi:hypothetical protein